MLKGLKNVKDSTTFWVWIISIVIQVLGSKVGIHGADTLLSETVAGGPLVYAAKEFARRWAGGR